MGNIHPIDFLYIFLILAGIGLVLALFLLGYILIRIRRLNIPETAGFLQALRVTPLPVVILLDLLDFSLDIFSAPVTWLILGRLGLKQLRPVAVVKDLIPFTNFVPAMTLSWVFARMIRDKQLDFNI